MTLPTAQNEMAGPVPVVARAPVEVPNSTGCRLVVGVVYSAPSALAPKLISAATGSTKGEFRIRPTYVNEVVFTDPDPVATTSAPASWMSNVNVTAAFATGAWDRKVARAAADRSEWNSAGRPNDQRCETSWACRTDIGRSPSQITGLAVEVHRNTGPGVLEAVEEQDLCAGLRRAGVALARKVSISMLSKSGTASRRIS